tara:strand:- start:785 stop:2464 length:1680 start_codon:yes stop_codon:yes gene_type:complete
MVLSQDLKFKLKKLFKEEKFSEVEFLIEDAIKDEDKSAGILNLLGASKINRNKKDKINLISGLNDFEKGYLKEKETKNGLICLQNFIKTSVDLYDIDKSDLVLNKIFEHFNNAKIFWKYDKKLTIEMIRVFRRLNDVNKIVVLYEEIIKNKDFSIGNLCSYIYFKNFQKDWSQEKFLEYGKFLDTQISFQNVDPLPKISKSKDKKIKIGFLSADLRGQHSITYFLRDILANYDKETFSIILISNQDTNDETFKKLSEMVDESVNISSLTDIEALKFLRNQKIDILVDIMGVTSEQRIELLNLRIAPIQMLWLGYCNTLGIKNMDYIIADKNLIYENEKKHYSEKVLFLPEIWNAHSGLTIKRKEKIFPHTENGFITFGSFNNFNKINEAVVKTWSNILKKIQNSKLVLKTSTRIQTKKRLHELFKKHGVDKSIIFLDHKDTYKDHLELYNNIDIALDTFPYNGVTTSFEAIWMSVPVLTMKGFNFKSRCGESINKNLNLEELIAEDENDYILKASNLAEDKILLSKMSNKIHSSCLSSPLFDTKKFSKNFFKLLKDVYN